MTYNDDYATPDNIQEAAVFNEKGLNLYYYGGGDALTRAEVAEAIRPVEGELVFYGRKAMNCEIWDGKRRGDFFYVAINALTTKKPAEVIAMIEWAEGA